MAARKPQARVPIKGDERPLVRALKRAESGLNNFARGAVRGFKTIGTGVGVIAAAGTALAALSVNALVAADDVGKMGLRVGLAAGQVEALRFAAEQSGASARDMDTAVTALARRAAAQPALFRKWGVSITDATGRMLSTRELLGAVAQRMQRAGTQAERLAIAQDLMSEAGRKLAPALQEGEAGLRALEQQAHALGLTIDDVEANSAAALGDRFNILGRQGTSLQRTMGSVLAPAILGVSDGMLGAGQAASEYLRANRSLLQSQIVQWFRGLGEVAIPTVATGTLLIVRAWYGWKTVIDVVRLAFNRYFELVARGLTELLGAVEDLARFANLDDLANSLGAMGRVTADLGTTFGESGDDAQVSLQNTVAELDKAERKIGELTAKAAQGWDHVTDRIRVHNSEASTAAAPPGPPGGRPPGAAPGGDNGGDGVQVGYRPGSILRAFFREREKALQAELRAIEEQGRAADDISQAQVERFVSKWQWAKDALKDVFGAIGESALNALVNGGNVAQAIGQNLVSLGTMLVQASLAALAINALGVIPFLAPVVGAPGMAAGPAALGLATGAAMIGIGKAMGGGGSPGGGGGGRRSGGGGFDASQRGRGAGARGTTGGVEPGRVAGRRPGEAGGGPRPQIVNVFFSYPGVNERRQARHVRDLADEGA